MSGAIKARSAGWDALASRLALRAASLAVSQASAGLLARRQDARRWRSAALLWPLFAKG